MKNLTPVTLLSDFYKLSHSAQYPKGTTKVYSTWTPRSAKFAPYAEDGVIVFGLQYFIKEYLIERFNTEFFSRPLEELKAEYIRFVTHTLGSQYSDFSRYENLHNLGYLPIEIKALDEGTKSSIRVPILTIENTKPEFFWLTNYLETIMSATLWTPIQSATLAYNYRKVLDEYAIKTTGSTDEVDFQAHDFSFRGMSSEQSAMTSGAGHLTSFIGSDSIVSGIFMEEYYNANVENELVLASIPATEHSVMCSYGQENEENLLKHLMTEVYPSGFFSVVSDTWDFFKLVSEYLPRLKDIIMSRDGRVVIRPDSGDPVKIITGNSDYIVKNREELSAIHLEQNMTVYIVEEDKYFKLVAKDLVEIEPTVEVKGLIKSLYDIFGGIVNDLGYKILDSHIGAIYGDSITLERAKIISKRLEKAGFATTNIVYGVGSFSYQYNTRDTLGQAIKATYAIVDGEERLLFKDPITDDGTKRSQRGMVSVTKTETGTTFKDGLTSKDKKDLDKSILKTVFKNGDLLIEHSLKEIRQRIAEQ